MAVYPVIFHKSIEGGYVVVFPDFDYGATEGKTLEEAIEMAEDAIAMMLAHYEDHRQQIPKPSDISKIKIKNGFVNYVIADTDAWRKQFSEKAIKKTVTIPAWLNYKAEEAGVNFSQELQNALKQRLQIAL